MPETELVSRSDGIEHGQSPWNLLLINVAGCAETCPRSRHRKMMVDPAFSIVPVYEQGHCFFFRFETVLEHSSAKAVGAGGNSIAIPSSSLMKAQEKLEKQPHDRFQGEMGCNVTMLLAREWFLCSRSRMVFFELIEIMLTVA